MKKRIINVIIIVITLFACITGIKAATILATSVTYGDMTVGEALDELIEQAHTLIDELKIQVNSNTNNINTLTTVTNNNKSDIQTLSSEVQQIKNNSLSSNLNMRYNEDTDMIQFYLNGGWVDWRKAALYWDGYLYNAGAINESYAGTPVFNHGYSSSYLTLLTNQIKIRSTSG